MEGEGSSESETKTDLMEIATASDYLNESILFHIISEVSGFILHMHLQIPSILKQITLEFDTLSEDLKKLESDLVQTLGQGSRRKCVSQIREKRQRIRGFSKLMRSVSDFEAALKLLICEVTGIKHVILALGATPSRPQFVYELWFSSDNSPSVCPPDFTKTRAADALSKKAIRALISKDAGSVSYPGTLKLFLLVKAPSSFSLPLHFLPKRDFRYNKKIVPFRVHIKSRTQASENMVATDHEPHTGSSVCLAESSDQNESIWFQCRHVIKGVLFKLQSENES